MIAIAFARAPGPLAVPGFVGDLQVDPVSLQLVATVPTSGFGASTAFLAVPSQQALVGLEVWLQAAVLPTVEVAGLTNAVLERLLN